jgi:hypothetical protein
VLAAGEGDRFQGRFRPSDMVHTAGWWLRGAITDPGQAAAAVEIHAAACLATGLYCCCSFWKGCIALHIQGNPPWWEGWGSLFLLGRKEVGLRDSSVSRPSLEPW